MNDEIFGKYEIAYVLFQKCLKKQNNHGKPLRLLWSNLELFWCAQYAKLSRAIPCLKQIATVRCYLSVHINKSNSAL